MIDSMDIYRAIKKTLENNFNIKVQIKDIKNPCPPCFYIKPITDSSRQTANDYETTDYSYSIIYFSEDETLEDLLTVNSSFFNTTSTAPLEPTLISETALCLNATLILAIMSFSSSSLAIFLSF